MNKNIANITTIQVTRETHDKLASFGGKDESFDDIIQKILKEFEVRSK
jgi:hypothetical protein